GEVFYFKTEPIRFWNGQHPEGITPDQLFRQFPLNRLIVLGDGHGLLDPHPPLKTNTPSLRPAAIAFFRQWKQRLLLTPMPVVSWTYREGALHGLFAVFPSDTEGLGETIKFLERGMDGEDLPTFASWCERLLEGRHEPDLNYRRWRTAADHRDYLQAHPELYCWVCALAVYPKPDWSITLAIGRSLSPLGVEVDYDNLLIISRIPWLLTGDLPPRLRRELLADLDSEAERLAREAVQAELQAVETLVQGGHANQEHQINLALQNFAIAPDSLETQASVRELLALQLLTPKHFAELNQCVERHVGQRDLNKKMRKGMMSQANSFRPTAPDIETFLEENQPEPPETKPPEKLFFTKDFWCAVAATLLFLLIFGFAWNYGGTEQLATWTMPTYDPKTDCQEEYLYAYFLKKECVAPDSAVLYNNAGVDAWDEFAADPANLSSPTWLEAQKPALTNAEKQFRNALRFNPDYNLAKENLGKLYYNTGVVFYHFFLNDSSDASALRNAAYNFRFALGPEEILLNAMHGIGLVHYYFDDRDTALLYYEMTKNFLDSSFYDTVQLYPNLQSLLARDIGGITERIVVTVTDRQTGKPLQGVMAVSRNTQGQTDPSGKIYLDIPLGEKRVYDFTKKGYQPAVRELHPTADSLAFTVLLRPQVTKKEQDSDKDGVPDSKDKCPKVKGLPANAGCPSDDPDGDGVFADFDDCPYEKGPPENNGCPIKEEAAQSVLPGEDTPEQQVAPPFKNPEMVFVKGGTFRMGCDEKRDGDCQENELPVHEVTLSDFSIGKYEVTNEEYAVFLNEYGLTYLVSGPNKGDKLIEEDKWGIAFRMQGDISKAYYEPQKGYENFPVVNVSWYGAVAYTEWLSEKTGKQYRLPTEAEWEYAARGGGLSKMTKYSGGNDLGEVAWHGGNSGDRTHAVGGKAANELGIFDMSGNVWEWCSDRFDEAYYQNFVKRGVNNPKGSASGNRRVIRGGSWGLNTDGSRLAYRGKNIDPHGSSDLGFRLAQDEYRASGF
ncbi:MAG: formylglycine-generating enzyme family protein, partial [Bacteroidetes bacterium]|nr:formylglycine-generating enzyme family protein [Bacteroidota bacterium]